MEAILNLTFVSKVGLVIKDHSGFNVVSVAPNGATVKPQSGVSLALSEGSARKTRTNFYFVLWVFLVGSHNFFLKKNLDILLGDLYAHMKLWRQDLVLIANFVCKT